MNTTTLATLVMTLAVMGGLAALVALLLFFASRFFHVQEDPRKTEVEGMLPGVNCGACGYPGCSGLAQALVKGADGGSIDGLFCPPGGTTTMARIAGHLGMEAKAATKEVAVLRCGGSCSASPARNTYDGPSSCAVSHGLFAGEGGCAFGCLREGDCVKSCKFDAMRLDEVTGLPVIDAEKCTACMACVKACPRNLIQMRPYGRKGRRVWVNCRNTEKGAVAKKNCSAACIGCGKCVKVCESIVSAITMENNLASINPEICIACGKCVPVCPTGAILATFPIKIAKEGAEA